MLNEKIIVEGILRHGVDILNDCVIDHTSVEKYLDRIETECLAYPIPKSSIDTANWFMPDHYKTLDIEEFLVHRCPEQNYERLILELQEYRRRNLIPLLREMKYIVDTLRKNNVVWGVGRGSSVASYILFLLDVHKIDSVKYRLPIEEFFKGEQNG